MLPPARGPSSVNPLWHRATAVGNRMLTRFEPGMLVEFYATDDDELFELRPEAMQPTTPDMRGSHRARGSDVAVVLDLAVDARYSYYKEARVLTSRGALGWIDVDMLTEPLR